MAKIERAQAKADKKAREDLNEEVYEQQEIAREKRGDYSHARYMTEEQKREAEARSQYWDYMFRKASPEWREMREREEVKERLNAIDAAKAKRQQN
jgi:hypothetical protein